MQFFLNVITWHNNVAYALVITAGLKIPVSDFKLNCRYKQCIKIPNLVTIK